MVLLFPPRCKQLRGDLSQIAMPGLEERLLRMEGVLSPGLQVDDV